MSKLDEVLNEIYEEEELDKVETIKPELINNKEHSQSTTAFSNYIRNTGIIAALTVVNIILLYALKTNFRLVVSLIYPEAIYYFAYMFTGYPLMISLIGITLISSIYLFSFYHMTNQKEWALIILGIFYIINGVISLLFFNIISMFVHLMLVYWTIKSFKLLKTMNSLECDIDIFE